MKIKISYRYLVLISLITLFVLFFISLKLSDKERLLKNQLNVIDKLEFKSRNINSKNENIIIKIKDFIEGFSTINYIKSKKNIDGDLEVQVDFTGNTNLIQQSLQQIELKDIKLNLNSINISKIDENNIECKFDAKIK